MLISTTGVALAAKALAAKLTDWENHKTDTAYLDALIQKIVVFEFVNNYFSLLYIAFFSTSRCRTTGSSTAGTRCPSRTAPGRSCRAG